MNIAAAVALAGFSAFSLVYCLGPGLVRALIRPLKRRPKQKGQKVGPTTKLLMHIGRAALGATKARRAVAVSELEKLLLRAGSPLRISGADLLALKIGFALLGLGFLALVSTTTGSRIFTVFFACLPVAGFFGPDFYLKRIAARRQSAITEQLPDFLDVLRITVEAGMPLQKAIGVTANRFTGELAKEFRLVATKQQLGITRGRALEDLVERTQVGQLQSFVVAIERSERHGVSLTDTLLRQARAARESRRRSIQEIAAKAGPKIQLVVALILVPAVLVLFAAAMVARIESGHGIAAFFG